MFQKSLFSKLKMVLILFITPTFIVACHNKSNNLAESTASVATSASVVAIDNSSVASAAQSNASMSIVGSDKDAHGCIPSAGYIWCTKENSCIKPWEYAAGAGIPNTEESVKAYCHNFN